MEAVFVLLFALIFYIVYRGLKGKPQTSANTKIEVSYHGKSYPFSEIKDDPNFPHVRSIHTKVRGVTHTNPDGVSRQKIIKQWCQSGDALYFAREPKNPVDPNAIQVRRVVCSDDPDHPRLGEQLGYVSRELAEELAPIMDKRGFVLMGWIKNVTGGGDGESYGVLRDYPGVKGLHWMQIPHHGSRRNITKTLIDAFAPRTAYVSAEGSKKHPRRAVINAFKEAGANVYSTHYPQGANLWNRVGTVPDRTGYQTATPMYNAKKVDTKAEPAWPTGLASILAGTGKR